MSSLKPARRWQPAFYPFKKEKFARRLLARIELAVKGPVFGCRMCGNCLLQETAFICPMECPKGMRNGPCGGITPGKNCYVDETRKCIWYAIYDRSVKTGREEKLLEVLPPLDWSKVGTETWGDVIRQIRKVGTGKFIGSLFIKDKEKHNIVWESVFRTIRQPEWWNGDSAYHPAPSHEPVSELERKLRNGEFVVATEVTPPLSANSPKIVRDIEKVKPFVSAVNFTDSSSAIPKMSSISCCKLAVDLGVEPVLQIASRDTTRNGLQAAVIGANTLGIKNILCITGDNAVIGPAPTGPMNFVDIDSVQMLWILRRMRDDAVYLDGRKIKIPPELFLGAATTPFAAEPKLQAIRDQKKVNAGAQFFQTNLIFEPARLDAWLEELDRRDVLGKVYILAGVAPLKSYRVAQYLNSKVPGVVLPANIMKRMEKAGSAEAEEGIQIALEIIDSLKKKKGINGIHLMTMGWEEVVERIIKEAGLTGNKG
ncbi:MAG TPA: methylenetetrahydrofolate reductase C-terminal domain-containing protein [Bacteroidales bacterium]|nr:methylenetetrahydrofolate reductase C-terminal domain-containing protein [Bacteroidales bacterium]HPF02382.1 methylenetetrahydrofolate reductase C-terminal domain-containing protein [Bacteroidales bacterium]HPJ58935.1 methylenetetrahydrofolate reductase C-terminal domain-containing protein [Bacteroidales bacterium]HPR12189.1 methylenetetrahydrofolate reductase C-terminal domain-containing protein [Bacteroidales bacterium]HRW84872.1 methylenetetrahydrofolate reductase C-terminal domain-contai